MKYFQRGKPRTFLILNVMILPQSLLYQQSTLIYRLNAIILVVAEDLPRPTHQVYKKKKDGGIRDERRRWKRSPFAVPFFFLFCRKLERLHTSPIAIVSNGEELERSPPSPLGRCSLPIFDFPFDFPFDASRIERARSQRTFIS